MQAYKINAIQEHMMEEHLGHLRDDMMKVVVIHDRDVITMIK
jgi:hypothetical protein